MFTYKIRKIMWIITALILALCLFALAYGAYDNLNTVRKSTNELDKGIDDVIIEWTADYSNDKELMDKIDNDLKESQARLEALGVEFDE